ncbi:MAG: hypothetical protein HQL66_08165 [Magnetococcales bacterium]|nr:hypothetical protein [Magnetococcales bacterium]
MLTDILQKVEASLQDGLATKRDVVEVRLEVEKVRKEIAETKAEIVRWLIGASGAIVALIKFLPGGY